MEKKNQFLNQQYPLQQNQEGPHIPPSADWRPQNLSLEGPRRDMASCTFPPRSLVRVATIASGTSSRPRFFADGENFLLSGQILLMN
jgi:hypothetical protein